MAGETIIAGTYAYRPIISDESLAALRSMYIWIAAFIERQGYRPTIIEVAAEFHLTYATALARIRKMEQRGWLRRDSRLRSMFLLGIPEDDLLILATPPINPLFEISPLASYQELAQVVKLLATATARHEQMVELFTLYAEEFHTERQRLIRAELDEVDEA